MRQDLAPPCCYHYPYASPYAYSCAYACGGPIFAEGEALHYLSRTSLAVRLCLPDTS